MNLEIQKYISYGALVIRRRLVYKVDTFMLTSLQTMGPIAMLFVWGAVYLATGSTTINNFSLSQIASYFFVVAALAAVAPSTSWGIVSDVKVGNVFMFLSKPLSYFKIVLSGSLANLIFDFSLVFIPIIVLLYVIFNFSLPLITLFAFALSFIISFTMALLMELFLGYLAFFITDVAGIINISYYVLDFFGGGLIPLNMFPGWIGSVASFLPFQFIFYYPASIFTHSISASQFFASLPMAALWLLVMALGVGAIVNGSKKHMDVVGI